MWQLTVDVIQIALICLLIKQVRNNNSDIERLYKKGRGQV